jgi:hypothetical protein
MRDLPVPKKEKWPSKLSIKGIAVASLISGIAGAVLSIRESFHLLHHGDKLNQAGVDDLIDAERAIVLAFVPTISAWLIYTAIAIWLYCRKTE